MIIVECVTMMIIGFTLIIMGALNLDKGLIACNTLALGIIILKFAKKEIK
jgi:hypothetical protein